METVPALLNESGVQLLQRRRIQIGPRESRSHVVLRTSAGPAHYCGRWAAAARARQEFRGQWIEQRCRISFLYCPRLFSCESAECHGKSLDGIGINLSDRTAPQVF